ncbi:hypothetical protein ACIQVO_28520 [Streptomyces sp. NPDC101062]|uniref:hypothetical protein n=1 Tax=unclassified Streptomyces TaxID=2593676 RepID=UPI002E795EFB|nr:hypothetical protein [Streptomyces sp. JV176]MEE1797448.1 hypothetical protein [Streptomyces sp. JV176]
MNDRVLWGVVALTGSLVVLVLGILYAWAGRPEAPVPVDAEEGHTYTCYCYRDPVLVTVRHPRTRYRRGYGRPPATRM